MAGWKKWRVIGPVYRTASEDEIREVRARYDLGGDQEACVFTMGGGGVHVLDSKGQDIIRFLRLASQVADVVQTVRPRVRLLFVRGPYFPARIPIPSRFEIVRDEEQMPALLKIAKGAVIRAGFNTTWECLSAETPFLPLIGTTYAEPVDERVNRLTSLGLVPPNIESFWFDDKWRAEYRRTAKSIVAKHSGMPEASELRRLIIGRRTTRVTPKSKPRAIRPSSAKREIPLVIRIDDVVCEEPTLCWLLDLLAARGLRASLEVVPYLMQFDQVFLDRFDPSGALFEVSQHGYAHVPRTTDSGRRCEFSPESVASTPEELHMIASGKQKLETTFPKRFAGGFFAPFDAMPPWLPAAWHSLGGAFVSCLSHKLRSRCACARQTGGSGCMELGSDRALSLERVKLKLGAQYALDGTPASFYIPAVSGIVRIKCSSGPCCASSRRPRSRYLFERSHCEIHDE